MTIRHATPDDAPAIAALHAASWRTAYRGMFSDAYLDGPVHDDRLRTWESRLSAPPPNQCAFVDHEDGELRGFICVFGDDDPAWGSLIDNLHAAPDRKRSGIGTALMRAAAEWLSERYGASPAYLWALEPNAPARRFYERLGGAVAETIDTDHADGGRGPSCRYVWPSPRAILRAIE